MALWMVARDMWRWADSPSDIMAHNISCFIFDLSSLFISCSSMIG